MNKQPAIFASVTIKQLRANDSKQKEFSQIEVFAGSPWEVASVKSLLKAASIEVANEKTKV